MHALPSHLHGFILKIREPVSDNTHAGRQEATGEKCRQAGHNRQ